MSKYIRASMYFQKGREIKAWESRAVAAEADIIELQTEVEQLHAELKYMTTQRNVWLTDEQSRCRDVAILQTENDELTMAVAEYTVMHEALKDEMRVSKRLMDALENMTDADAICTSRLMEIKTEVEDLTGDREG